MFITSCTERGCLFVCLFFVRLVFTCISLCYFWHCLCFMKPDASVSMVLKSGDGVGSEPVQQNVIRHVENFEAACT